MPSPHTQVSTQPSSLTHVICAAAGGDGSDGSNWGSRPSVTRAPFTVRSAGSSSSLAHGMGAGRAHTSIGAHAVGAVKVRFGPPPALTHALTNHTHYVHEAQAAGSDTLSEQLAMLAIRTLFLLGFAQVTSSHHSTPTPFPSLTHKTRPPNFVALNRLASLATSHHSQSQLWATCTCPPRLCAVPRRLLPPLPHWCSWSLCLMSKTQHAKRTSNAPPALRLHLPSPHCSAPSPPPHPLPAGTGSLP